MFANFGQKGTLVYAPSVMTTDLPLVDRGIVWEFVVLGPISKHWGTCLVHGFHGVLASMASQDAVRLEFLVCEQLSPAGNRFLRALRGLLLP